MSVVERDTAARGQLGFQFSEYGRSVNGLPLEVLLPTAEGPTEYLIFGGIHGQEPETTLLLSRVLRSLANPPKHCAVILAANPDGILAGTRANANGVDLNRNFPSANWSPEPYLDYWNRGEAKCIPLSTGSAPGSEPETRALIALVTKLKPRHIISLHGPLDCIDDPQHSELGKWMEQQTGMPLVGDIGYPTTGSFGSWCAEQGYPVITYELPLKASWEFFSVHVPVFQAVFSAARGQWRHPSV